MWQEYACPKRELVERYVSGKCSDNEQQEAETHITSCDSCRQWVDSTRTNLTAIESANDEDLASTGDGADDKTLTVGYPTGDECPTRTASQDTVTSYEQHAPCPPSGAMIEGYEITEELPRGGQAVVYKAIHTATKRCRA